MKKFFVVLCIFVAGIILYACNKSSFLEENIPENKLTITDNKSTSFAARYRSGSMTMVYSARENNSVTESSLEFFKSEVGGSPIAKIDFSIDDSQPAYKLLQHENIINQAKSLSKQLSVSDAGNLSALFEPFGESIIADKSTNSFSQVIQSVAFHKAILSAIKRAGTAEDCGCTPHPGYFVNKTFFLCQEDVSISPGLYVKLLKNGSYKLNEKEKTFLHFLEQKQNENSIPASEVFGFIESKDVFLQRVNNSASIAKFNRSARLAGGKEVTKLDCLKGSDWGCCGNYEGCCWFAAVECYLHDMACSYSNCKPRWACGPQCKPD